MHIVICGGGVIGACVAYSLSRRDVRCTVVERHGLACAASGKSGGFLALDWCDGTPLEALARRSFALHAELAEHLAGDWGYRRLDTFSGSVSQRVHRTELGSDGTWLSGNARLTGRLGSPANTAQVHPGRFTHAMMKAAEADGAQLIGGKVTDLVVASDCVRGVRVNDEIVEADAVVIALGPWSRFAQRWAPLPQISGLKGHSLVFDTGTAIPAQALFLEWQDEAGVLHSPEVFPRADGTTYVCAFNSEAPLPADAAAVSPETEAIERLQRFCEQLSPVLAGSKILARQACYRPMTRDGLPVIGAVPHLQNAFIATGHSVWGILNAPATGEAIADLILNGETQTIDLRALSPNGRR
jgi:glycine/D-amino acid oxidase-like deaminating enzyme